MKESVYIRLAPNLLGYRDDGRELSLLQIRKITNTPKEPIHNNIIAMPSHS